MSWTSISTTREPFINPAYKHRRSTVANVLRNKDRFTITADLVLEKDRLNTHLLKSVLYEEKIKDITSRLTIPTCSTAIRSEAVHPVMKGHDVKTIELWTNMSNYDNHFLKRMYDKVGNSRIFNNKQIPGAEAFKPLPKISCQSREVHVHPLTGNSGFSYKQQWATNQATHSVDFKKPPNRSI